MNLSRLVLVSLAAIVVLAAACNKPATGGNTKPGSQGSGTPDEFTAIRASYAKHCVSCHGANADGGAVTVEGKKLKVPSLRTGRTADHSDKEFGEQITKGGDGMPAFADKLSAKDVNDMVHFIRKEFQGK
jgi:mono/diheme cytochrome c family protein